MEALEEKDTLLLSVAEHLPLGTLTARHTLPCIQMGLGLVQVGGQAEPQLVNCWPLIGHPGM